MKETFFVQNFKTKLLSKMGEIWGDSLIIIATCLTTRVFRDDMLIYSIMLIYVLYIANLI